MSREVHCPVLGEPRGAIPRGYSLTAASFRSSGGVPRSRKGRRCGRPRSYSSSCLRSMRSAGRSSPTSFTSGPTNFPWGSSRIGRIVPMPCPPRSTLRVDGCQWWLSFAADDATMAIPGKDTDTATEQIAEDLRHLSRDQLAERTLGGDRGVAKPLATSDGQVFDLQPVQKAWKKNQRQRKKWQRRAARRKKGSKNRRTCGTSMRIKPVISSSSMTPSISMSSRISKLPT